MKLDKDNAEYHYNLGQSLYYSGKYSEAEAEYRIAVKLEPYMTVYRESLDDLLKLLKLKN